MLCFGLSGKCVGIIYISCVRLYMVVYMYDTWPVCRSECEKSA